MKRKLFALLLAALVLSATLCATVFADDLLVAVSAANALITDRAGVLTDGEEAALTARAERLSRQHDCDVAVLLVDSLGGQDVGTYAEDQFLANGYDPDGILLVIAVNDREMIIRTMGKGIDAVTDYGEEEIYNRITSAMSRGDYNGAIGTYLDTCDSFLTLLEEGTPYDYYGEQEEKKSSPFSLAGLIAGILGGSLFGGVPLAAAKREIKNVRSNNTAGSYVRPGSLQMYDTREIFLHQNVTRVPIPGNDNRSGGAMGGGTTTHVGSGGATFGGGGGHKF